MEKKNVVAIIPVGGEGKRLRPHTHIVPKALVSVGGKPILGHIIDSVLKQGVDEFVFVLGYLGNKIKDYVSKAYPDIKANYVLQKERYGVGHAIYLTKEFVNKPMFVIFGDTILKGNLNDIFNNSYDAILGVKEIDDPRRFGVVEVKNNVITKLVEKPNIIKRMPVLVGAYYIKNYELLFKSIKFLMEQDIKVKGEYQLTDAFQIMVKTGAKLSTFYVDGWLDCGLKESLLDTNKYVLDNYLPKKYSIPKNSVIIPPVYIGSGVDIKNSIIGPHVSIDDNVLIENTIITDSIVNKNTKIKNTILSHSIIGAQVIIEEKPKSLNIGDSSEFFYG